MKQWRFPSPIHIPDDFRARVGGHEMIAEALLRRGITTIDKATRFLDSGLYTPASAFELPNMDKAVERIQRAIREQERILIWGDFDVDGQTSTALLASALTDLGANFAYHVPDRFKEGHGIHSETLEWYIHEGVKVVLTCDTGIAAHEAIDLANQHGVDVVVTDHHSLPDVLPNAYALVNPMRLNEGHVLRELPGVGTAYKFVQALNDDQDLPHLLDLVATGIVADVMVQVDDTRYLLQEGLQILKQTERRGLQALMDKADINASYLTETDIGFSIAPRLNALGRILNATPAVELLTSDDPLRIAEIVNEIEGLNNQRKFLTRQVHQACLKQIEDDDSLLKYAVLVLVGKGWHTGVVGIVASRLSEDFHLPTIVLSEKDGVVKGSARSVDGVNIVEAIRSQAHLLNGYGGHTMAAGMSMSTENILAFRRGISPIARTMMEQADVTSELLIDRVVGFDEIGLDLAQDIARLAPFGNGNPPLTLATQRVKVKSRRQLGRRGDHIEVTLIDEHERQQDVKWWFGDMGALPSGWFDVAYTLRESYFRGENEALLEWIDTRPIEDETVTVKRDKRFDVIDYRKQGASTTLYDELVQSYPDAVIYYEGLNKAITGMNRYDLYEAETLIVWTIPAGLTEWLAILGEVQPQRIILVGDNDSIVSKKRLYEVIVGMSKYAVRENHSVIDVPTIIAKTGQRERTIHRMLEWISGNVTMKFTPFADDYYRIETQPAPSEKVNVANLDMLIKDTQAYQRYWLKSDIG